MTQRELAMVVLLTALPALALALGEAPETSDLASKKLRILSIMPFGMKSHHLWMAPLTVRLAERGHLVHSVDIAVPRNAPPTLNVTVIDKPYVIKLKEGAVKNMVERTGFQRVKASIEFNLLECEESMSSAAMKQLIDPSFQGQFDLFLLDAFFSNCRLGFLHRFNYPTTVLLTPYPGGATWIDTTLGNPYVPAAVPHFGMVFRHSPPSLWERLQNVAMFAYDHYLRETLADPATTQLLREVFGPAVPPIAELRKHVSLALVNEVPILDPARPFNPSVIPVGGMHTSPANLSNIPSHLKEWMDSAKDGFIFMSFGSIMKGSDMDDEKRNASIKAFGSLRERILWKFETDDIQKHLPPNVRTDKWLPQNDILGHPNILLFISHCGGLSTHEAAYHGVPVLCVPHMLDQFLNAKKLERMGMANQISQSGLSEGRLLPGIREMLANPRYREKARQVSVLMRDQKEHPLDRAVWWVEYAARHGGARHLRSPVLALRWYQVLLLDVHAVLAAALLLLCLASLCLARCCLSRLTRKPAHKKKLE